MRTIEGNPTRILLSLGPFCAYPLFKWEESCTSILLVVPCLRLTGLQVWLGVTEAFVAICELSTSFQMPGHGMIEASEKVQSQSDEVMSQVLETRQKEGIRSH
jgi:hypothetical protein